jgi:glycosyltransferase involved in cell wall biosynthesis
VSSISAIIPVYNGERYLAEAIESVLAQTLPVLEIVVIDDGSNDASAAVAARFAPLVKCEVAPHSGPGGARNRGVALTRGELLAFLDADDRWERDKLALQATALAADADLDAVFGHVRQFHSPELADDVRHRTRILAEMLPGYHPGTMLIRREAFERVGPFETTWQIGEFVSWHARASDCGLRMLMLPDVVMHRRLHEANLGIRKRDATTDYVRQLKATLDRRRGAASSDGKTDSSS